MLTELRKEWIEIRHEKKRRIKDLIKKAVDAHVHVVLFADLGFGYQSAQAYLKQIGLEKNEFISIVHILELENSVKSTSLCIPFEFDCL